MRTIHLTPEELKQRGILELVGKPPLKPESAIAHQHLDGLKGVEIGPAAYQPFGLNALAVSTGDPQEREFYRNIELLVCGAYVEIDAFAEADALPFADNSQDFVLSSHVIEHVSNPIAAFIEWNRVVRDGGYIYMIFPHARGLPYGDEHRVITPMQYFFRAYFEQWTNEQAFDRVPDRPTRQRGHFWVFTLQSMEYLIEACNLVFDMMWELEEFEETDDAAGEGHLVLYKVDKETGNANQKH